MEGLLAGWRPDVAHVHAPSRYLTPSVLRPLERAGVPVVMTLHDFKPWCTNRILFAHGAVCRRCRGGRHWRAAATGCVQGSRLRSTVAAAEAYLHDARHAYRAVRLWIAPSRFVADEAAGWGVPAGALRVLAHGVEPAAAAPPASAVASEPPFVLFAGRLSVEKGVRLLPALAARLRPTPVRVVGEGPLAGWLDHAGVPNLERLGRLDDAALAALRARAAVVVVPSLFVEHFGYALAEAMLDARPVVAARIGALPELVEHEVTGLLVPPGDAEALADAARRSLGDPAARGWGEAARARVRAVGDPARHLAGLLAVYREAGAART
jgi:glycosyltransferase involved in cell wall biosynthesis